MPWFEKEMLTRRLWRFLGDEKNRQILNLLGGGAVVIVAGIWALVTFFYSQDAARQPSQC